MNIDIIIEKIDHIRHDMRDAEMDIQAERRIYERKVDKLKTKIETLSNSEDACFHEILSFIRVADLNTIHIRTILKHIEFFGHSTQISERLSVDDFELVSTNNTLPIDNCPEFLVSFDISKLNNSNFRTQQMGALKNLDFSYFESNEAIKLSGPIAKISNSEDRFVSKRGGEILILKADAALRQFVLINTVDIEEELDSEHLCYA